MSTGAIPQRRRRRKKAKKTVKPTQAVKIPPCKSTPKANGYTIDIFKNKPAASQYKCNICRQVCKNPVELSCISYNDHDDLEDDDDAEDDNDDDGQSNESDLDDHSVLYCQLCLSSYLSANNNQCPIDPKHLDTKYNLARSIRKQINNLIVICYNNTSYNTQTITPTPDINEGNDITPNDPIKVDYNSTKMGGTQDGCNWSGKLSKLSHHLKICEFNKIHCEICGELYMESKMNQHHQENMVQHIAILHAKLNSNPNLNTNIKQDQKLINAADSIINDKMEQLITENNKLKESMKSMRKELIEWKSSHKNNHDSSKQSQYKSQHDSLRKQLQNQSQSMELLKKQHKQLLVRYESQNKTINSLTDNYQQLKSEVNKMRNAAIPSSSSKVVGLPELSENKETDDVMVAALPPSLDAISSLNPPGGLQRTSSMKYYHPEKLEFYHPQDIQYQVYHPKKSEEVWVIKTIGNMAKLDRYPCCGSAKEASMYLVKVKTDKKSGDDLYAVMTEHDDYEKLPDYWTNDIHLGCKKNKKRNKRNKSFYKCCKGNILSNGCKQRYKCCHQDIHQSEGCQVGWGC